MTTNCLISVIVPCYNQGIYLAEALDSIVGQTYSHWECIIVNDGSTDNTEDVAKTYCDKDSRFKYLYKKNGGLAAARNTGIEASSGYYLLPLDADDKISSNYLEECLKTISCDDEIKLVYGAAVKFGYVNELWNLPDYDMDVMLFRNVIHCTALYRKKDWQQMGGYDVHMKFAFEDWEFWLSMLKMSGKVIRKHNITFFYRTKQQSMLKSTSFTDKEHMIQYVYTKHAGLYDKYFINPIRLYKEHEELKRKYAALQQKSLYAYYTRLKIKIKNKLQLFL